MHVHVPSCTQCGACCSHPKDSEWVEVFNNDYDQLSADLTRPSKRNWSPLTTPPYVMKQNKAGTCIALEGTLGKKVNCNIYNRRPRACRALRRGSKECHYMLGVHCLGRLWPVDEDK